MTQDHLSTVFSALADPTRRAILASLTTGEASVQELAKPFKISQPGISRHLKVLEQAGLIERGREAQYRPCKLKAAPLKEATDWLLQYKLFWEQRLDRLEEYLQELQMKSGDTDTTQKKPKSKKKASSKRTKHGRTKK